MRDYIGLANIFKEQQEKKCTDDEKNSDLPTVGGSFQEPSKFVRTIFGGLAAFESKHDQKLTAHRIMNV